MATINMALVFENVANRLKVKILQIMARRNVRRTIIDEKNYREFERNHPVGTLFSEDVRSAGFQATEAQRNQFVSNLRNANRTTDAFNVTEAVRLNAGLASWDPSDVTPSNSPAQAAALVVERLAEHASAVTGSFTTVPSAVPSADVGFSGASRSVYPF